MIFMYFGGASIAHQWYCPPEVGAMEVSSEITTKLHAVPVQAKINE